MRDVEKDDEHPVPRIGRHALGLAHGVGLDAGVRRRAGVDDDVLERRDLLRRAVLEDLEVLDGEAPARAGRPSSERRRRERSSPRRGRSGASVRGPAASAGRGGVDIAASTIAATATIRASFHRVTLIAVSIFCSLGRASRAGFDDVVPGAQRREDDVRREPAVCRWSASVRSADRHRDLEFLAGLVEQPPAGRASCPA